MDEPLERHDESKSVDSSPLKTTLRSQHRGFMFAEVIVIAILGIISLVVAFSVRGVSDQAVASGCDADARPVTMAAESYLAKEQVDALPAAGTRPNRYELALIDAGLRVQVSTSFDRDANGPVTTTGQACP